MKVQIKIITGDTEKLHEFNISADETVGQVLTQLSRMTDIEVVRGKKCNQLRRVGNVTSLNWSIEILNSRGLYVNSNEDKSESCVSLNQKIKSGYKIILRSN